MPISRTIAACTLSGLLVAAALLLTTEHSLGQFPSPQDTASWWPPHPEDQVHLFTEVQLPLNSDYVVYEVPLDRWLVVVPQAKAVFSTDGSIAAPSMGIESVCGASIFEDRNGTFVELGRTAKYWGNQEYESGAPIAMSSLGWTLAPGSRLVLRNSTANQCFCRVDLFGYLAPVR